MWPDIPPSLVVSSNSMVKILCDHDQNFPEVFPACAVTQAQISKTKMVEEATVDSGEVVIPLPTLFCLSLAVIC